jgi:5-(carboxyamino)imidazole ribonucleotide synthase
MGYDVRTLDPDEHAPAFALSREPVRASFDDVDAAVRLANGCAVVTLEIEQVSTATLEAAARTAPVRPSARVVHTVQERGRQKEFLAKHGFPLGDFAVVETAAACTDAVARLGPSIVKATMGGYDGRGQIRVRDAGEAAGAFEGVGARRAVVEQFLDIEAELSVLVARSTTGEVVAFPPSRNHHEHGILVWAVVPSEFPPSVERQAVELAKEIATSLDITGLLAVEMFLVRDGRLLVNELAPRPHNTYHHTERACDTSQFEQLVRAICGLPLGDTAIVRPTAIYNLLGDLWEADPPTPAAPGGPSAAFMMPNFVAAWSIPGVRVHLYGKKSARPGRKMGHISACGDTAELALRNAQKAFLTASGSQSSAWLRG